MLPEIENEPNAAFGTYRGVVWAVLRSPTTWSWCGYVHASRPYPLLDCHGGVTFMEEKLHTKKFSAPPGGCWTGFDCGHGYDYSPKGNYNAKYAVYRDIAYVRNQIKRMIDQILVLDPTEARYAWPDR